jgi:hypothetical protein
MMSDHYSTQELINQIESKDRKFRTTQAFFMLMLLATLIAVIFVQFRTLDTVRQQLTSSKATAVEATKQGDEQRKTIIRRLDCMTAFFSQTDRQNLTIKDVDKCSISSDGSPEKFFAPANGSSSQVNTDGSTTTTTTKTPGNPGATNPKPATNPQPTSSPVIVEPRPPVEVLGVPVCLPFTEVCAR